MAFNPAINRLEKESRPGQPQYGQYADFNTVGQAGVTQQQYGQMEQAYAAPSLDQGRIGRLSLDDVFVKTALLFGIVLAVAAGTWVLVGPQPQLAMVVWLAGMFGSLGLSLVIAFMKSVNVPLILLHAAAQGAFVGAISVTFESFEGGIVVAAVLATMGTFTAMLMGWKVGLVKVSSRAMRIFGLMAMGYLVFQLVNLGFAYFAGMSVYSSSFGWIVALVGVGMAAYSLAIDFETIDRGVSSGLPEKYSWLMAHGLVASLVWVYIEILRLLYILRSDD
ncbi:Bax inhibitor-1/YccA family protein [Kytococcus sp. Marseille-QA3725]